MALDPRVRIIGVLAIAVLVSATSRADAWPEAPEPITLPELLPASTVFEAADFPQSRYVTRTSPLYSARSAQIASTAVAYLEHGATVPDVLEWLRLQRGQLQGELFGFMADPVPLRSRSTVTPYSAPELRLVEGRRLVRRGFTGSSFVLPSGESVPLNEIMTDRAQVLQRLTAEGWTGLEAHPLFTSAKTASVPWLYHGWGHGHQAVTDYALNSLETWRRSYASTRDVTPFVRSTAALTLAMPLEYGSRSVTNWLATSTFYETTGRRIILPDYLDYKGMAMGQRFTERAIWNAIRVGRGGGVQIPWRVRLRLPPFRLGH